MAGAKWIVLLGVAGVTLLVTVAWLIQPSEPDSEAPPGVAMPGMARTKTSPWPSPPADEATGPEPGAAPLAGPTRPSADPATVTGSARTSAPERAAEAARMGTSERGAPRSLPSPLTASITGSAGFDRAGANGDQTPSETEADDFPSEKLEELDYQPPDVDALRDAWEQSRADLEDRLAAIDPTLPPRARREQEQEIQQQVLDELLEGLGSEDYDALLYALGESNRIAISWIPPNSPQERYGLEMGDQVLSVGGIRFDSTFEYMQWLQDGGANGEAVPVQILRDGELIVLDVPNGDIGRAINEVSGPPPR